MVVQNLPCLGPWLPLLLCIPLACLPRLCLAAETCAGWPDLQDSSRYWPGSAHSLGNHRWAIRVAPTELASGAVAATLPWRRSDRGALEAATTIVDAQTNLVVEHCSRLEGASADAATFVFAASSPGLYHAYTHPFVTCEEPEGVCRANAKAIYDKRTGDARSCGETLSSWLTSNRTAGKAVVHGAEAKSVFHAFTDMETPATAEEEAAFFAGANSSKFGVVVVGVDRSTPIMMRRHIPAAWATTPTGTFTGLAQPGEKYSFQLALAMDPGASLPGVTVTGATFTNLVAASGDASIPASLLRVMNLNGTDHWQRPMARTAALARGDVLSLWCAVPLPQGLAAGTFRGAVTLSTTGGDVAAALKLVVRGPVLLDGGDSEPWRGTRLLWLDSTLGAEPTSVPPPFTPLQNLSSGQYSLGFGMLDKQMRVGTNGLLASVVVGAESTEALRAPMRFDVRRSNASSALPCGNIVPTGWSPMKAGWTVACHDASLSTALEATIDATGYAEFVLTATAKAAVTDVEFELVAPMAAQEKAGLLGAGLGFYSGYVNNWFQKTNSSDDAREWRWDGVNGNNGVWIGSVSAGLRIYPKGDEDTWNAGVPFDGDTSPPPPDSWSNGGKGGARVTRDATVTVFTGPRDLASGESLVFRFSAMATPVRPLDLPKHFGERYAQLGGPDNYTAIKEGGATVVNMHQGNVINPWINYPYLTNTLMKQAADAVHALGMRFKVYNTMRELSNRARELWAMRSLNETFVLPPDPSVPTPGAGSDWLQEHLQDAYLPAWSSNVLPERSRWAHELDAAVKVKALSRWNNYYVEGLRQLKDDFGSDGIYLDEIAYGRVTMMRAKNVLGREGLIDHHSDQYGTTGGMGGHCSAVNYLELFPFIDSLWYGEGFDYDGATPDNWLVDISGIPFGLNSDMLRYTGMTPFHFRGMLFASANRWQGNFGAAGGGTVAPGPFDPNAVWRLWDSFGISSASMFGWWNASRPVEVDCADASVVVKATAFVHLGKDALVVLSSFGSVGGNCSLSFDWGAMRLPAGGPGFHLRAPQLLPMQPEERVWELGEAILVPASSKGSPTSKEGWMLLLEKKGGYGGGGRGSE